MANEREIETKFQSAGEEYAKRVNQRNTLLNSITDAHRRMATNRDAAYRKMQQEKVDGWLEELTQLSEKHPNIWMLR